MDTFGKLLRGYREAIIIDDPVTDRRKPMSQRALADKLSEKLGWTLRGASIGNWERNEARIANDDRTVLLGLISIFVEFGSIQSKDEASRFLRSGGYSSLEEDELGKVNPNWDAFAKRLRVNSRVSSLPREVGTKKGNQAFSSSPVVFGRNKESQLFLEQLDGSTEHRILNIFGPGGIGKTVVARNLARVAAKKSVPTAFVSGYRDMTSDRLLFEAKEDYKRSKVTADMFEEFESSYGDFKTVNDLVNRAGGVSSLFDSLGNLNNQIRLSEFAVNPNGQLSPRVKDTLSNRFVLERYLRRAEEDLTESFLSDIQNAAEVYSALGLIIDTYEELEGLDEWVCEYLLRPLPPKVYVVMLGRLALPKMNFEWGEFDSDLKTMSLPELGKEDALAYLKYYGLSDNASREAIYKFTGGYPLLLALTKHLAKESGGWDKLDGLERSADRDVIASNLLQRILRQEKVKEVRAFLEKGVIARWFDPGTIKLILGVSSDRARELYDKLQPHSFVEPHPRGLKFHDKIRELLCQRLEFTDPAEYKRLGEKLTAYYAERAGINSQGENKRNLK